MSIFNGCGSVRAVVPFHASNPPSKVNGKATTGIASAAQSTSRLPPSQRLHRLGEARKREGMTCSKVARRLGISLPAAEEQERPSSDILLSDLYRWQKVLGVPAAELLKEPNGQLSKPVALRAKLVRVMKTAKSIQERADRIPVRRLAQSLARQLVRIMPELQDTTAWPVIGPHRGENELGQAFFRRLPSGPWDVLDRTEE